jgi:MscS family membrane protein
VKMARVLLQALALLVGILLCSTASAIAADTGPLSPLDTSSPRATLQGFIETVDGIYARLTDVFDGYAKSDRLYLTSQECQEQIDLLRRAPKAIRAMDVSGIPPVLQDTVPIERALQLKEILDRIELPPLAGSGAIR